ncbi:hypothetical protein ACLBW2_05095 [Enterobacteriaceae bacterium C23F]
MLSKYLDKFSWLLKFLVILTIAVYYPLRALTSDDFRSFIDFISDNASAIVSVLAILVVAIFLISYVNKGIGVSRSAENDTYVKLKKEFAALKNEFEQLSSSDENKTDRVDLSSEEKKKLIESAKKRIIGNTLQAADISLKNDLSTLKHQVEINKHYSDIVYRLENEIDRLNRRGGVNLVIGAAIAAFGIIYLGFAVTNQIIMTDKLAYVIYMLPKLSFVIVIELFAYFFLKLYKNGFEEVKYFQNELTNIDVKVLGIKFLKDVRNEELMGEVIKNLMTTERNFILEKGQSTVSLEQQKVKVEEDKYLSDILKEILKSK